MVLIDLDNVAHLVAADGASGLHREAVRHPDVLLPPHRPESLSKQVCKLSLHCTAAQTCLQCKVH